MKFRSETCPEVRRFSTRIVKLPWFQKEDSRKQVYRRSTLKTDVMEYFLRQIDPGNPHPIIVCLDKDEVIVGRKTVASLCNYLRVSRQHAAFHNINGVFYIRDVGTFNNLYVNFERVGKDMRKLEIGDIIGFGVQSFTEVGGFHCVLVVKNKTKQEVVDSDEPRQADTLVTCCGSSSGQSDSRNIQATFDTKDNQLFRLNDFSAQNKIKQEVTDLNDSGRSARLQPNSETESNRGCLEIMSQTDVIPDFSAQCRIKQELTGSSDCVISDYSLLKGVTEPEDGQSNRASAKTLRRINNEPNQNCSDLGRYVKSEPGDVFEVNNGNNSKQAASLLGNKKRDFNPNLDLRSTNVENSIGDKDTTKLDPVKTTKKFTEKNKATIESWNDEKKVSNYRGSLSLTKNDFCVSGMPKLVPIHELMNERVISHNSPSRQCGIQEGNIHRTSVNSDCITQLLSFPTRNEYVQFNRDQALKDVRFTDNILPVLESLSSFSQNQWLSTTDLCATGSCSSSSPCEPKSDKRNADLSITHNPNYMPDMHINSKLQNDKIVSVKQKLVNEVDPISEILNGNSSLTSVMNSTIHIESTGSDIRNRTNWASVCKGDKKFLSLCASEIAPSVESTTLENSSLSHELNRSEDPYLQPYAHLQVWDNLTPSVFVSEVTPPVKSRNKQNSPLMPELNQSNGVSQQSDANLHSFVSNLSVSLQEDVSNDYEEPASEVTHSFFGASENCNPADMMSKCFVVLKRCDDFLLPSDMKRVKAIKSILMDSNERTSNFSAGTLKIKNNQLRCSKSSNDNCSESSSSNDNCSESSSDDINISGLKKFKKRTMFNSETFFGNRQTGNGEDSCDDTESQYQSNYFARPNSLKLKRNRILSSESSSNDNESVGHSRLKNSIISSESETSVGNSESEDDICDKTESDYQFTMSSPLDKEYLVQNPSDSNERKSYDRSSNVTRKNQMKQDMPVTENFSSIHSDHFTSDDSDCDKSLKSVILYPSPHILKDFKKIFLNEYAHLPPKNDTGHGTHLTTKERLKSIRPREHRHKQSLSQHRKMAKALLTEPKPMERIPRRIRRGEEYFQERKRYLSPETIPQVHKLKFQSGTSASRTAQNVSKLMERRTVVTKSSSQASDLQRKELGAIMVGSSTSKCNYRIPKRGKKEENVAKQISSPPSLKEFKNITRFPRRASYYGSRMGFLIETSQQRLKSVTVRNITNSTNNVRSKLESSHQSNVPKKTSKVHVNKDLPVISLGIPDKYVRIPSKNSEKRNERLEEVNSAYNSTVSDQRSNRSKIITNYVAKESYKNFKEAINYEENKSNSISSTSRQSKDEKKNIKYSIDGKNRNKSLAVVAPFQKDKTSAESHSHCSSLSLIKTLVQWNPKWLDEQKENAKPPPVGKAPTEIPLFFENYKSYISCFYPLLVLDLWELLYREYKQIFQKKDMNWNNFYYRIISCVDSNGMTEMKCEAAISEILTFCPFEGSVILLNVQDKQLKVENCVFGYIFHQKLVSSSECFKSPEWQKIPRKWLENAKLCVFSVYVKKKLSNWKFNSLMSARSICDIKYKLCIVDCMSKFQSSPLAGLVIQPKKIVPNSSNSSTIRQDFVEAVCNDIIENLQPKMYLIQGFPGTGKTHVIMELVEKLLFSNTTEVKVFVCSSSNSTLNEIGLRLIELKDRFSWRSESVQFVMVGNSNESHPKMRFYLLDKWAAKIFKEQKLKAVSIEKDLKRLGNKINSLVSENDQIGSTAQRKLKILMSQYESLKQHSFKKMNSNTLENCKCKLLNESDVIISTFNNFQEHVSSLLSSQASAVTCCIVDEASLCTEPELLQCLASEVSKLILVGDASGINCKHPRYSKYQRSMFERFCSFFEMHSNSPVFILKEQHRMHSEICRFPSQFFYQNKILISPEIDERYKYFSLKPYTVLDILSTCMTDSDAATLLNYICTYISRADSTCSIGVIADKDEVPLYEEFLSHNQLCRHVEVKTVDGFRSKEKDVMIAAFIKTGQSIGYCDDFVTSEEKLSIILTRARKSLLLYGHISTLNQQCKQWKSLLKNAKTRNVYYACMSSEKISLVMKAFVSKPS